MTCQSTDTCASCRDFDLNAAAKAGGVAECEWRGKQQFSDRACVLYMPAKDREHRRILVAQLREQTQEAAP